MKNYKKGIAISLTAMMTCGMITPVFASDTSSDYGKEEVVYVMTDANGSVDNINVVNIFEGGSITDYGDYLAVKMLTTTDKINKSGDKITFTTDADRVYYQGTLNSKEIPWNISVKYYLDDKEYSPSKLAGKSGALKIKISITQNTKCDETFYEDYALQASFTLNTDICKNINADGATLANVGSDKQITYTILPGKGLDASITADVVDFEMDAASINGIKLKLNLDIDDQEQEITDKVSELIDATTKLNDGTQALYDGTTKIKSATSTIDTAASSLNSGSATLDSGISSLQSGMQTLKNGLDTLSDRSSQLTSGSSKISTALKTIQSQLSSVEISTDKLEQLTSSSSQIKQGISDLYDGIESLKANLGYAQYKAAMSANGLDIDALKAQNEQMIENCSSQIVSLQENIAALEAQVGSEEMIAELNTQITTLQGIIQLITADNASIDGTESYLNTVSSGTDALYDGISALKSNYEQFDSSISGLADTLSGFTVNLASLKSGIDQLNTAYSSFDSGITSYTDGVASVISGYNTLLNGVASLASGSKELLSGSNSLSNGTNEFYENLVTLCDGAKELNDGTSELASKTSDMDTQIQDKIDDILASIEGDDSYPISFVSDKNTNVKDVQFVIKTSSIEKSEPQTEEAQASESKSILEKFISLFGF